MNYSEFIVYALIFLLSSFVFLLFYTFIKMIKKFFIREHIDIETQVEIKDNSIDNQNMTARKNRDKNFVECTIIEKINNGTVSISEDDKKSYPKIERKIKWN